MQYTKLITLQLKLELQLLLLLQLQLQQRYHYITLHYANYITLHSTRQQLQLTTTTTATTTTTLHYTTLRYTVTLQYSYNYSYNYNCDYITLHYTTLISLHHTNSITLRHATPHYTNYNYSYNYTYTTLDHTRLHYRTQHYSTLHYTTLHYTTLITPHHSHNCNYNYTTLITLHYNYNSNTLQLQLQLHYTTLHPAVVGEVTAATIATTPKSATPTTFRSISGFALPSMHHNNPPLLQRPFLETSAAALSGTTGTLCKYHSSPYHDDSLCPYRLGISNFAFQAHPAARWRTWRTRMAPVHVDLLGCSFLGTVGGLWQFDRC